MKKRVILGYGLIVSVVAGLAMPSPAAAQCRLCANTDPIMAESEPDRPLTIDIESGLSFDRFAIAGNAGGVAAIDPLTGQRRLTGALVDLGGFAVRGTARLRGDPGRMVRVDLPSSVTMSTADGEEVELTELRSDLPANPQLDENGQLRFSFGGRLYVSRNSLGNFRGRIRISAEYQ